MFQLSLVSPSKSIKETNPSSYFLDDVLLVHRRILFTVLHVVDKQAPLFCYSSLLLVYVSFVALTIC